MVSKDLPFTKEDILKIMEKYPLLFIFTMRKPFGKTPEE